MGLTPTAGGYSYLPGGDPYSSGVVADESHQIVRALLLQPVSWRVGFDVIAEHLADVGRSRQALCAIELRSPTQVSFEGFSEFNLGYRGVLGEWGLLGADGSNPVARTNVVPLRSPPQEPSLCAFSYTVTSGGSPQSSFVTSGAGELVDDVLTADAIVRRGDSSSEGMAEKMNHVLKTIGKRLRLLGGSWHRTTAINVYTGRLYPEQILEAMHEATDQSIFRLGIHWYPALPPVEKLEFEMDARGVWTEIAID